jgi:hypothetical protein
MLQRQTEGSGSQLPLINDIISDLQHVVRSSVLADGLIPDPGCFSRSILHDSFGHYNTYFSSLIALTVIRLESAEWNKVPFKLGREEVAEVSTTTDVEDAEEQSFMRVEDIRREV